MDRGRILYKDKIIFINDEVRPLSVICISKSGYLCLAVDYAYGQVYKVYLLNQEKVLKFINIFEPDLDSTLKSEYVLELLEEMRSMDNVVCRE